MVVGKIALRRGAKRHTNGLQPRFRIHVVIVLGGAGTNHDIVEGGLGHHRIRRKIEGQCRGSAEDDDGKARVHRRGIQPSDEIGETRPDTGDLTSH